MEHIIMSSKENERVKVVHDILAGRRTQINEAKRLKVTTRCIRYWIRSFEKRGAKGLVHGNRKKKSPRCVPKRERMKIVSLIRKKYADFGPTLATEKLVEQHGIQRDTKTIRSIMVEERLWIPQNGKRRMIAVHRSWRERRSRCGELVQFDGSYHNWLEGRDGSAMQCLLAAVDDATGELMWVKLAPHEGTLPVMGFFTEYANEHGFPASIYLDRFSTYKMTQDVAIQNPDLKTQLQRAMKTLGVDLIFALSPQAKGRIERLFKTLQDRLVKELRIRGISSVRDANHFLEHAYLALYSNKYGVEPKEPQDAHRPLSKREKDLLPETLCRMESRVLRNDFTVSFESRWFQVLPTKGLAIRPKDPVVVRQYPNGELSFAIRNKHLSIKPISKYTRQTELSHPRHIPTLVTNEITNRKNSLPWQQEKITSR
ncbi:MAG: ISNCY family transposase [Candidatus Uhrbacteria bacterium]|nr:ISNCY family transposase [Candidatus Uhrbacteria bacterium]